ncbi:2225_t:CDS:2 [Acaulospora morrowiae]|uniref:2225_t:CDS:1 n=1 Tax=Acaulospora morrowiae TaxID=94023 RepID=A0A9N9AIE2_9GLOM|nr:2225_t:CDS:2 [Acaulospora morrowiae]
MRLNGFSLEILVNGEPLVEITEPTSKCKNMTTGPSHTRKSITAPEDPSPMIHYAAVQEFGTRYAIRFSAPPLSCQDDPIKVFLYVDGEYDYSYTDINPLKLGETRTCFWSKNRDKIYYFKFDPTIWSEEDDKNRQSPGKILPFGGPGAVSVYFYRAQRIAWNVAPPPDYNVEPTVVPENNNTRAIKLSTQYEVQSVPNPTITRFDTYLQEHGPPLAVLHLHYRAAAWLRARGHSFPSARQMIGSNLTPQCIEVVDDQSSVKIKQEGVTIKEEPVDDLYSNAAGTGTRRRKKSSTPEIIVLSSDDEDHATSSKKTRLLNNGYSRN